MLSIPYFLKLSATCAICDQSSRQTVCLACQALLTSLGPACQYCAFPLPDDKLLICSQCLQKRPIFDRIFTAYRFEEPLRSVLHEFKYQSGLYLTAFLSTLLLHALPLGYTSQCLIPIPLHTKRLYRRGFNQSALLASHLARILNIPCHLNVCRKTFHTQPQVELSAKQRHINLESAFSAKTLPYRHITLIDDLVTTGSTANAVARVFKKQGVERVDVVCCARAY